MCVFMGFTDQRTALEMPFTLAAGNVLTSNASNAVGILFDTAADTDNWWLVGVASDIDATKQDTGAPPAAAAAEKWRIEINDVTATFYKDDVQIGTPMTSAVTANVTLYPVFCAFSRNAASKTFTLSHLFVGKK
jgi:hypothetical protein